jgi:hypothetical protein
MGAINQSQITPFDLVQAAYQGQLKSQGIPSAAALMNAYNGGDITAIKIIEAGIQKGLLSPDTLNDSSYVSAVDTQLATLANN